MEGGKSVKIALFVMVVITAVLGIVALGVNDLISQSGSQSSQFRCSIAFTIIAVIVALIAAILYLVLMLTETEADRILAIVSFTLMVLAFVCYLIACACGLTTGRDYRAWLLSAFWCSVLATVLALVLVVFNADE
ncbi:hypothetical protein EG68_02680 [Paragonimus skrjabini miyazakii]|uniref:Uncharacterized protein n=1 Tax=Paragonimus skrjabini miyazakii TaxID=59628 RepID=A0A8S9YYE4_9TREM|nr:hypothetical protein EG68_02680 [Paragonimus skrjabini miyazakii]